MDKGFKLVLNCDNVTKYGKYYSVFDDIKYYNIIEEMYTISFKIFHETNSVKISLSTRSDKDSKKEFKFTLHCEVEDKSAYMYLYYGCEFLEIQISNDEKQKCGEKFKYTRIIDSSYEKMAYILEEQVINLVSSNRDKISINLFEIISDISKENNLLVNINDIITEYNWNYLLNYYINYKEFIFRLPSIIL